MPDENPLAVTADDAPAGSPRWWLDRLYPQLLQRRNDQERPERYYNGKHRLAFATPKFRATFGNLFQAFADNWCPIVVDSSVERMTVEGFRVLGVEKADDAAWDLWKRNYLDADSGMAMTELVKLGASYALVEPPARGSEHARITVEHPGQVVVAKAAGDRRRRAAALKCWLDETGHVYATVYTPVGVYKFQSTQTVDGGLVTVGSPMEWEEREGVQHASRNPFGVVPVVPLENTPGMITGGVSDLATVIPVQDAVNKLVLDMLVASEYAAFRQRWATGVEVPTDEAGNPVDEERFLSFIGRVWAVDDPDAKFGEFGATDLNNYVGAIGMLIQHLSAQSKTPPHYLIGQVVNASGDALKAAETGLVSKVRRKLTTLGPAWGEVMHLALPDRRPDDRIETLWRDPEVRSVGELVDAATKMKTLGVPDDALWEFIGATPEQVKRWKQSREAQMLADQALLAAGANPADQGLPGDPGTPEPITATGQPGAPKGVVQPVGA